MNHAYLTALFSQVKSSEETAAKIGGKVADVGTDMQNKLSNVESAQEFMQLLGDLAKEYLVPFAINLAAAALIFFIGRWIARILTRFSGKFLKQARVDETLHKFLLNIVYAVLLILVIVLALGRLGVDTTSFAAILGAAGLAVGFALKDSLANFASGVMLVMFKPFVVGDFVDAGGVKGVVEEVHLFNTLLRTGDNIQIIVPNGAIMNSTITNYSAKDTRRIDLVVGCGYGDDLQEVKHVLVGLLENDGRILKDPEPVVAVSELGDSSVDFVVRPWVKSEDYFSTRCDLTEAIKTGFDQHGFTIPYPTRDVFMHNA